MTYNRAQKIAREHGISIRKGSYRNYGKYRVAYIGDSDIKAAYELTLEDALDAAQAIEANKRKGFKHYWVV